MCHYLAISVIYVAAEVEEVKAGRIDLQKCMPTGTSSADVSYGIWLSTDYGV
jgi:hypothetical protein